MPLSAIACLAVVLLEMFIVQFFALDICSLNSPRGKKRRNSRKMKYAVGGGGGGYESREGAAGKRSIVHGG